MIRATSVGDDRHPVEDILPEAENVGKVGFGPKDVQALRSTGMKRWVCDPQNGAQQCRRFRVGLQPFPTARAFHLIFQGGGYLYGKLRALFRVTDVEDETCNTGGNKLTSWPNSYQPGEKFRVPLGTSV